MIIVQARHMERRTIKPHKRYGHAYLISYALIVGKKIEVQEEPHSYDEVISNKDNSKWIEAMEEEMSFLEKNCPKGQ